MILVSIGGSSNIHGRLPIKEAGLGQFGPSRMNTTNKISMMLDNTNKDSNNHENNNTNNTDTK